MIKRSYLFIFLAINLLPFISVCAGGDEENQLNTMELTEELKKTNTTTQKLTKKKKAQKKRKCSYTKLYSSCIALSLLISGACDIVAQKNVQDMVAVASPILQFSTTHTIDDFSNSEQCTYSLYNGESDSFYDYTQGFCERKSYTCITKDCDPSDSYKKGYMAHFIGNMITLGSHIITTPVFVVCALSPVFSKCVSSIVRCPKIER